MLGFVARYQCIPFNYLSVSHCLTLSNMEEKGPHAKPDQLGRPAWKPYKLRDLKQYIGGSEIKTFLRQFTVGSHVLGRYFSPTKGSVHLT